MQLYTVPLTSHIPFTAANCNEWLRIYLSEKTQRAVDYAADQKITCSD